MKKTNSKFGKNHDKKNCPYCKSHKKHPNGSECNKSDKKPREGEGIIGKLVRISKGVLHDVCGHKDCNEKFGFYRTNLTSGKWVRINTDVVKSQTKAFKMADIVWSYEKNKFVKDTHGIMESMLLFNKSITTIMMQSRYIPEEQEKKRQEGKTGDETQKKEKSEYSGCISAYEYDYKNKTVKNLMTGEVKAEKDLTTEERNSLFPPPLKIFHEVPNKEEEAAPAKKEEEQSDRAMSAQVMDNMTEVAHRLKKELDSEKYENKQLRVYLQAALARIKAFESIVQFKNVMDRVDELADGGLSDGIVRMKSRKWSNAIYRGLWNCVKIVSLLATAVTSAIGIKRIIEVIVR